MLEKQTLKIHFLVATQTLMFCETVYFSDVLEKQGCGNIPLNTLPAFCSISQALETWFPPQIWSFCVLQMHPNCPVEKSPGSVTVFPKHPFCGTVSLVKSPSGRIGMRQCGEQCWWMSLPSQPFCSLIRKAKENNQPSSPKNAGSSICWVIKIFRALKHALHSLKIFYEYLSSCMILY